MTYAFLTELSIKNYAIIEALKLEFSPGLNIFTGETGAGKSIIIDSLEILLGEKASQEVVRQHAEKSIITGVFSDEKNEDIIISRHIDKDGKSKCYYNDNPVTLSFISQLGEKLVDVHGQHQHQTLLKNSNQLTILDKYGGLNNQRQKLSEKFLEWQKLKTEVENLKITKQDREQKIDLYEFQIKEIDSARLKKGEDEEIDKILPQLKNAGKIIESLSKAYNLLLHGENSIIDGLQKIAKDLSDVPEISLRIESIVSQLKDISREIERKTEQLNLDPYELEQLIDRKDTIIKLKKKYGSSIEEILVYRDKIKTELEKLKHSEEDISELEKKIKEIETELRKLCNFLSKKRKEIALKFEKLVEKELQELGMPKAKFKVNFEEVEVTSTGIDKIEFLFSANVGEDLKPLKEIASGGELSRIMLALKTVLGRTSDVPIMVFDEIDAGVSGPMGRVIGQKLYELSKAHQIICITHLPQIASFADRHFKVEKIERESRTLTVVNVLDSKEKQTEEIARMLSSGKITKLTLEHAKEILSIRK